MTTTPRLVSLTCIKLPGSAVSRWCPSARSYPTQQPKCRIESVDSRFRGVRKRNPHKYSATAGANVHTQLDAPNLLSWLQDTCGAQPYNLKVRIGDTDTPGGRGLLAEEDLLPDEVILSIPMSATLVEAGDRVDNTKESTDDRECMPWSARMAFRILQGLSQPPLDGTTSGDQWRRPWLNELPKVHTPPFQFSEAELSEIQDPATEKEARFLRGMAIDTFQVYEEALSDMGLTADDYFGALSVCHSRCFRFGEQVQHLMTPGIDMANHSLEPNAAVRYQVEPSQGVEAVLEVSDSVEIQRMFQLRAGEEGITAGTEITISYGSWPNDVFFLLFGFCPDHNENDSVVLFRDLAHLVESYAMLCDAGDQIIDKKKQMDLLVEMLGANPRLSILGDGVDGELSAALGYLLQSNMRLKRCPQPTQVLKARCLEMLAEFPTSIEDDTILLQTDQAKSDSEHMTIRYRRNKKTILKDAIACM
mmetsp:Transcript_14698/g.28262  ORF Transcript_14698/g.28262 Transcript_14698/m.28262 type:complete len:476 (+) Transcript_14698:156-1583(+)